MKLQFANYAREGVEFSQRGLSRSMRDLHQVLLRHSLFTVMLLHLPVGCYVLSYSYLVS